MRVRTTRRINRINLRTRNLSITSLLYRNRNNIDTNRGKLHIQTNKLIQRIIKLGSNRTTRLTSRTIRRHVVAYFNTFSRTKILRRRHMRIKTSSRPTTLIKRILGVRFPSNFRSNRVHINKNTSNRNLN